MSVTFSNANFTQTPAAKGCMGYLATYVAQTDTSLTALDNQNWYAKPALFAFAAANLGETAASPGNNVFALQISTATPLGVDLEAQWTGTPDAKIGRCWFRFQTSGGFIQVSVTFKAVLQQDFLGYAQSNLFENSPKLLRNERTNPQLLANDTPCVFNQNKAARLTLWVNELSGGDWSMVKINTADDQSLRFFAKGLYNAPMERILNENMTFWRNNTLVDSLSSVENTTFRFRFEADAVYSYGALQLFLLRTDTANNSVYFLENYQTRYAELPFAPAPFVEGVSVADFSLADAAPHAFVAPAVSLANVSGNIFQGSVTLNAALLNAGATYRLLAVLKTDDGANEMSYSFLSPELPVCTNLALDAAIAPKVTGTLSDFRNTFGSFLTVAPKERLLSRLQFDAANYNAARPTPFAQGLKNVRITFFTLEENLKHVLAQYYFTKNQHNQWNLPPGFSIDSVTGKIAQVFRTRCEANKPNLYTLQLPGGAQTPPLSNQDWSGRTVYLEYELTIPQPDFTDTLVYTQALNVKNMATNMTAAFTIDDLPAAQFCNGAATLAVCVTAPEAPDDARLLTTIEPEPFSQETLTEHESFAGGGALPQLSSIFVTEQDSAFSDETACLTIDAQALATETAYRLCAIVKGEPLEGCGGATPVSGGVAGYRQERNVGLGTGALILAYQMYGFLNVRKDDAHSCPGVDSVYLNWNGFAAQSDYNTTCTAVQEPEFTGLAWHFNDGVLALSKTAPFPSVAQVVVDAHAASGETQWWFKLFCPGVFLPPRGVYTANPGAFRIQSGTHILLHEEAFAFEWDGQNDVSIQLNIPPQTFGASAVNLYYQFSLYYNGALVDRTTDGTFVFIDGAYALNLPAGAYVAGEDYFVVIATLWPANAGAAFTLPPVVLLWEMTLAGAEPTTDSCPTRYEYPRETALQDNNTETQCFLLPEKTDCQNDLKTCAQLWNNNLCGTDKPYFQPVYIGQAGDDCQTETETDLLYLQFRLPDPFNHWDETPTHGWLLGEEENWLLQLGVTDGCCNPLPAHSPTVVSAWVGEKDGVRLQSIVIDPTNLPDCFAFSIRQPDTDVETCGLFQTEPYRKARCENTLLLEGVYPRGFDCLGNFYAVPQNILSQTAPPLPYRNAYRIPAELRLVSMKFEKEDVNSYFVSSRVEEKYELRTAGLPPYAVDRLIPILSAPQLLIDGVEYRFNDEININNEAGQMWYLSIKLSRLRCEQDFKCN